MITNEAKVIKYLAKEITDGNAATHLYENLSSPSLNWENLKALLIYHELIPFLYPLLKKNSSIIAQNIFSIIKECYYSGLLNYMLLFQELLIIIKESKKENINIIPIKGLSFTEKYYEKFGFRPIVDIDLLIKEDELEKGVKLLENLGYKKHLLGASENYWRDKQCHLEFIKKTHPAILTELHWALDFKRYKSEVIPGLWERIKEINIRNDVIKGEVFYVLSPEDTLFSLVLHQRRFGKMLNLKYVCDTGIILEKEIIDWDYICKTAAEEKINASLYFLLYQVQFVLDKDLGEYLKKIKISSLQKKLINNLIQKYTYSPTLADNLACIYTLCHFLLYDNLSYPIKYILTIPKVQFAKFYSLPLESSRTEKIYRLRLFFIIYRLIKDGLKKLKHKGALKRRASILEII